jgi:hypothetical protein
MCRGTTTCQGSFPAKIGISILHRRKQAGEAAFFMALDFFFGGGGGVKRMASLCTTASTSDHVRNTVYVFVCVSLSLALSLSLSLFLSLSLSLSLSLDARTSDVYIRDPTTANNMPCYINTKLSLSFTPGPHTHTWLDTIRPESARQVDMSLLVHLFHY